MKHLKSIVAAATGLLALAACQNLESELGKTISVDKTELTFASVSAEPQTLTVTSDGEWLVSAPDWVIVSPSYGTGKTEVSVSVLDNVDDTWRDEVAGPRSDVLVFGGEQSANVIVKQLGEAGLDATRTYSRVASASEFDATKNFLITTTVDDKILAANNIASPWAEDKYYYWSAVVEVEENDGVITRPNASLGFSLVPATTEGAYYLVQPNGTYVYQSDGHPTSFYCTADVTKANEWKLSFDADGYAVLVNTLYGDDNYFLQYTKGNYSEWITGTALGDTEHPVTLYQDSAAATDEVLSIAESFSVGAKATSLSVPVESNKTWKVRCHDNWITDFTASGEGDGTIEISFIENDSKTDARTATFTVIGETTSLQFTVEQGVVASDIAGIVKQITGTNSNPSAVYAELDGAVVSYKSGSNVYIEDQSGAVLLYSSSAGLEVGDAISGVIEGSGYLYSNLPELTTIGAKFTKTAGSAVPETEMTIADLLKNYNANISRRIKLVDVEVTGAFGGDDRDGELTQGTAKIALRSQAKGYAPQGEGTKGNVIVFPSIYNSTRQLAYYDGLFTVTFVGGSITASDVTVKPGATVQLAPVANVEGVTFKYESADPAIATVSAEGLVTGVADGETTVTISFEAGEGYGAASKTIKVSVVSTPLYTVTADDLPTSYPTSEQTKVLSGLSCYILNVANFGNGIQMKKDGSYIANTAAIGTKISTVRISWQKNFYPENLEFTFGTSAKPSTKVTDYTSDTGTMTITFDLSASSYTYFMIKNPSTYASYLKSIEIEYVK